MCASDLACLRNAMCTLWRRSLELIVSILAEEVDEGSGVRSIYCHHVEKAQYRFGDLTYGIVLGVKNFEDMRKENFGAALSASYSISTFLGGPEPSFNNISFLSLESTQEEQRFFTFAMLSLFGPGIQSEILQYSFTEFKFCQVVF
jgi:hypothetical protein